MSVAREVIGNATLCNHPKVMIAQTGDENNWCFFCADCNLHGDRARTRKAAERKWIAMIKAQAAWRQR